MSFEIDGVTWTPKTTIEHANSIMNKINSLLQENDIKDDDGNLMQLKKNYSNAMWLLTLGAASVVAENDTLLSAAINSFNIPLCDDAQIENLLPIAAVERNAGSYSTLKLTVTASLTGECSIPKGTKAPFGDVNFVVQDDVIIPVGESKEIETKCDTLGAVTVLKGEVTAFEDPITNLESVINEESSVPGTKAETINDLRQKIVLGNTIKYTLDGCRDALEILTGVSYARIYFNYNTTEETTLAGGVKLKPRHAYIVIYGESDLIAETYAQYMSAPTQNAEDASEEVKKVQNWITTSGQTVPIYYDLASEKDIYVKVVLKKTSDNSDQVVNQIKRILIESSASWEIGESVTALLTSVPFADITFAEVAYTLVSADGVTYDNVVDTGCNVLARIKDENIIVEQLE